jgi:uncharacterized membrane protein YdjX (TVP38/TMEM64 family)
MKNGDATSPEEAQDIDVTEVTGKGRLWDALIIAFFVFLSVGVLFLFPVTEPEEMVRLIGRAGWAAPVVFILITALKPVLIFLPSMGLTIVAGLLFGPYYGALYVTIGGVASSAIGFYVARRLGRHRVEKFIKGKHLLATADEKLEKEGFKTVLLLRIFNLPWDMVSYSAGLSKMGFKDFFLASLIMLPPTSFIYTYFGGSVRDPISVEFFVSLGAIILMGAIPYILDRLKRGKNDKQDKIDRGADPSNREASPGGDEPL